ncbi:MAG: sigma-70 family RNA polymerase sigma factor [bacterium]|nr:sigma-70 family RNA polymerase sigma factor [bacterium]
MTRKDDMDLAALSDEELALALKAGDDSAFDELVRRHQGRVYAVAYRITSNREDALDVAQDALIKAYRKVSMWEPTSGFVPWLLRLTANQAIDLTRRRKRRRTEPLDATGEPGPGQSAKAEAVAFDTERQVHAGEIDDRVQAALVVLSPAQRAVFVMRHYEGLQLAEIAEVQGCTVGSVKVHLFRALKKMQVELADLLES